MPSRLRVIVSRLVGPIVLGLVIAVAPPPAWAAIVITPQVNTAALLDQATCSVSVVVLTFANFSENVRVDGVEVSFGGSGGPLGLSGSHTLGGGATSDQFVFKFESGNFKPGVYSVTAAWLAHNGNGLSRATAKATGSLTVPPFPNSAKAGKEAKCGLDQTATDYRHAALTFSAAAYKARSGCLECAYGLEKTANLAAELAMLAEDLAADPPDPNFTTLPVVVNPTVVPVSAGVGISADVATAWNDALHMLAEGVGQARAALTAVERAQGAHDAGDSTWEERQSLAAAGFFRGLATRLTDLPTKMDTLGARMKAGGFPNPVVDAAAVQAYVGTAWKAPKPAGITDEEFQAIRVGIGVAATEFIDPIALLDAFAKAGFENPSTVAALNADAAALMADPLLNRINDAAPTQSPTAAPSTEPPTVQPTIAELPSLLSNSGFEAPALNGSAFQTLTAGKKPGLDGWQLKSGSIDLVTSGGGLAATGGQFIDLSGNDTEAGPGTITQKVKVTPGHKYKLSFQLAGNPNGDPPVKTIEVRLGSEKQTFTFDTTGHTNADLGWTTYTMEVNAPCGSSSMTVTFASKTEGSRGPNLDNVVLADAGGTTCSGFPIWWVVLGVLVVLAVAGVAVYLYLRRRSRAAPTPPPLATD